MPTLIENIRAYVLHVRRYTDSKNIVSFIAETTGRTSCVVRVSKKAAPLQPFVSYEIAYSGKGSLKTLASADQTERFDLPPGRPTYCGMYLNELLVKLLPELESHDALLSAYQETLKKLTVADNAQIQEILLRRFEFTLLDEFGLGFHFDRCADFSEIEASDEAEYKFVAGEGFVQVAPALSQYAITFTGSALSEIAREEWTVQSLRAAKALSRLALRPLLGYQELKARELFQ